MDWQDEGVLLAARPHGETSAIAEVFTLAHGRHAGVVRGGSSRRQAATLQPGTQVAVAWQARLADHLGSYTVEPLRPRVAVLSDAGCLAALTSACALLRLVLPERAPHAVLWQATVALFDGLDAGTGDWPLAYLRWEIGLLDEVGFGLDLSRCAVTGTANDLAFVSPKSGRAVSRVGAGDWAARLLPLPRCLLGETPGPGDIAQGLALTGHFLTRALPQGAQEPRLPEARVRLAQRLT